MSVSRERGQVVPGLASKPLTTIQTAEILLRTDSRTARPLAKDSWASVSSLFPQAPPISPFKSSTMTSRTPRRHVIFAHESDATIRQDATPPAEPTTPVTVTATSPFAPTTMERTIRRRVQHGQWMMLTGLEPTASRHSELFRPTPILPSPSAVFSCKSLTPKSSVSTSTSQEARPHLPLATKQLWRTATSPLRAVRPNLLPEPSRLIRPVQMWKPCQQEYRQPLPLVRFRYPQAHLFPHKALVQQHPAEHFPSAEIAQPRPQGIHCRAARGVFL